MKSIKRVVVVIGTAILILTTTSVTAQTDKPKPTVSGDGSCTIQGWFRGEIRIENSATYHKPSGSRGGAIINTDRDRTYFCKNGHLRIKQWSP
jgi:hypothetical protein